MILDEEVFAVVIAISVVASAIGIAVVLAPENPEPFMALGLLNEECKIGEYPATVVNNTSVELCLFVANYMNKPVFYRVVYKISGDGALPTNTTSLPVEPLLLWHGALGDRENTTKPIKVYVTAPTTKRIALVFELWVYDTSKREWVYTGVWNHLYVNVTAGLSL